MESIVVRPHRSRGYELVDPEGKYLGEAPTLAHLRRFAEAAGASVEFDPALCPDRPAARKPQERWFIYWQSLMARLAGGPEYPRGRM